MMDSSETPETWRLGSRTSELAMWQTNHVRALLKTAWPELEVIVVTVETRGDQILETPLPLMGGKGLFTAELEAALRAGIIDAAVHSLKDLPTELPDGLVIGAIPQRENPADVLVSRDGHTLESLPMGATVGTSSKRRAAQLLSLRPDLRPADIRGNVPTRLRKAFDAEGPYDAIVLAYAGLKRLDRLDVISQLLPLDSFLPAPGQGALAVQCRDGERAWSILAPLDHHESRAATGAERAFLNGLGGGCALPIAAYATEEKGELILHGSVLSADGHRQIELVASGQPTDAGRLGFELAQGALERGAADLLEPVT